MKRTVYVIFIIMLSSVSLRSEDTSFVKKQKNFVKELYQKKRYFDFIGEAERLKLFNKNESPDYCIYTAYYHGAQYNTIINYYRYESEKNNMLLPAALLVSRAYTELGNYSMGYSILENYSYNEADKDLRLSLFSRRIESLIYKDNMELIKGEISAAEPFFSDYNGFISISEALLARENIRLVSPPGAAVMSALLPGSGQIYSGYVYEGILSFLSVAATMAGGFYLKDRGETKSSYTLFFFSGLFYAGNIYGAYNSALQLNSMALEGWRKDTVSVIIPFNPDKYCHVE